MTHALSAILRKTLALTEPFIARLTHRKPAIEVSDTVNGSKNEELAPCSLPLSLKKEPSPCPSPILSNSARLAISFLMFMGVGLFIPSICKTPHNAIKRFSAPMGQSFSAFFDGFYFVFCAIYRSTYYRLYHSIVFLTSILFVE